jgi:hypothetical protein
MKLKIIVFWLLLLTGSANAAGPNTPLINIGLWTGGSFTNDQTGEFSHCAASVSYVGGNILLVGILANGEWELGFMNENWQLVVGQGIPVDLNFDGDSPSRVYAIPITKNMAIVTMPKNSSIIKKFKEANRMDAFALNTLLPFNLDGTKPLFPALINCIKSNVSPENAKRIEKALSDNDSKSTSNSSGKNSGSNIKYKPKRPEPEIVSPPEGPGGGSLH